MQNEASQPKKQKIDVTESFVFNHASITMFRIDSSRSHVVLPH
jgi:hypothetical protein